VGTWGKAGVVGVAGEDTGASGRDDVVRVEVMSVETRGTHERDP
jgi:hypothetical protein